MRLAELVSCPWDDISSIRELGPLLRRHGVDLCGAQAPGALRRGTPVYVQGDASPIEVQRRMVQARVQLVFVLDHDDSVLGVIDIAQVITRDELRVSGDPSRTNRTG